METIRLEKSIEKLSERPNVVSKFINQNQYTTMKIDSLKKELILQKREVNSMKVFKIAEEQKMRFIQGELYTRDSIMNEMKRKMADLQFQLGELNLDKLECFDEKKAKLERNEIEDDKNESSDCHTTLSELTIDRIPNVDFTLPRIIDLKDQFERIEPTRKKSGIKSSHARAPKPAECKQQ